MSESGFSLLEAAVAALVGATLLAGVAPMFVIAQRTSARVHARTLAVAVGVAKLEQLRSMEWRALLDPATGAVTPRSDVSTNASVMPPTRSGPGLQPGSVASLLAPTAGYVDYLDGYGRWVATGAQPPPQARFVRRWAIVADAAHPADLRVLHVLVADVRANNILGTPVRLASVRARVLR